METFDKSWQWRLATAKDAEAISRLANAAFRGETAKKGWTHEADLVGGQRTDAGIIAESLAARNSVFLVIPSENLSQNSLDLLACVHLEKMSSTVAYLGMLTVDPLQQAGGVGKFLLHAAEDYVMKTWGVGIMEMTVITHRKELVEWYMRRGYQSTGRTKPFPDDNPRHFGIPKMNLEFMVLNKKLY